MEALHHTHSQYRIPAEFREAFAREEHRHNCQAGLVLSLCALLLLGLLTAARFTGTPPELSALLDAWPLVPLVAVGCAFSLGLAGTLLALRRRERTDAPLSSIAVLAYACIFAILMVYQAQLGASAFGIMNINLVVLAMVIVALMVHFPLSITLLLETGVLAITLAALLLDKPYISNFYPSLVDMVVAYLLISLAATWSWRLRVKSFSGTRRLSNMAHVDSLTQVQNRRGFDEALPQVWKRMGDAKLPLSLLMVDVDFFKSFNDTYGHQAGDDCLRQVAGALAASVRARDFVGRYGGEEFVVLLPGAGLSAAQQVGARMMQEMASRAIPHEGNPVAPFVTFSIGCACCRPGLTCESPEALVHMADDSLYMAKDQGRARLVPHPDSAE